MPREIITDWSTPAGGGFATVMFWEDIHTVSSQRATLGAMWSAIDASLNSGVRWTVRTSGRVMNDATGTLTGVWSEPTGHTAVGGSTVDPIPDATQVLLRWETGVVVGGRMLKGRSFVPGLIENGTTGGNVDTTVVTGWQTIINNFLAAGAGFGVWHRPVQGAGGQFITASSGSVWPELAVLRRRRA